MTAEMHAPDQMQMNVSCIEDIAILSLDPDREPAGRNGGSMNGRVSRSRHDPRKSRPAS
jgi:hypothetical protein